MATKDRPEAVASSGSLIAPAIIFFSREIIAMDDTAARNTLERETLLMHAQGRPGKIEIMPTKPLVTQKDLSLAYSPGVAYPCLHIARAPSLAYDYTAKGNLVAVISNGTAVLGLGDLGASPASR